MVAQRFLIITISLVILSTIFCSTAHAQSDQAVVIPNWIKQARKVDVAKNAARNAIGATADAYDAVSNGGDPIDASYKAAIAMLAARNAYHEVYQIGRYRRVSVRPAALRGNRVVSTTLLLWDANDLLNGKFTPRNTTNSLVYLGVGTGASAGLMVLPGLIGATASTGTAISTLSGAAYTSASLAWWGGGAAAAGGGGMAVGSVVVTGGAIIVAAGVVYGGYKVWNMLDPAERDAMNMHVEGMLQRSDLTDADTPIGAELIRRARQIDKLSKVRR